MKSIMIVVYFVGVLICYYTIRRVIRNEQGEESWYWGDVALSIGVSASSFFGLVMFFLVPLFERIKTKPPKWL